MVDVQVPPLGCPLCVGQGLVGHEPRECLGDQSVQRGGADLVREPRDLGVDEPGGVHREPQGGLGDPPRAPGRQVVGLHPGPDPRQAVLQLHRVRHQRPPGLTGDPQRGRELGQAELRHPRRTRTRQRQRRLPTGDPRGRFVDRLRRVLLGPEHRRDQHIGLRSLGIRATSTRETEHVRGAVQLPDPDARARLHTPNSSTDHRQAPWLETPSGKAIPGRYVSRTGWFRQAQPAVGTAASRRTGVSTDRSLRSLLDQPGRRARPARCGVSTSAVRGFDKLNQRWARPLLGSRGLDCDRSLRQAQDKRCSTSSAGSRPARCVVSTSSTSGGHGRFSAYGVSTDRSLRQAQDKRCSTSSAGSRPARCVVSTSSTSGGHGRFSAYGVSTDRSLRLGSGQALRSLRQAQDKRCSTSGGRGSFSADGTAHSRVGSRAARR